ISLRLSVIMFRKRNEYYGDPGMRKNAAMYDGLLDEANALAGVVTDYSHFGEMAHALRVARRALHEGELVTDDTDAAMRLGAGQKIVALAREAWVAARA
ncbi:MAG TPA: hypothetical protein VIS76_08240, partial [Pseudomonadales bacterium]